MCKNKRTYTEEELREMQNVRKNQPHICFYCKKPLGAGQITVDHVVPYIRGGKTSEENLVISCSTCNSEKSDMDLDEYMKFLEVKFKALKVFNIELEETKLKNMQEESKQLEELHKISKQTYQSFLGEISSYNLENTDSSFTLQKLQFLIWEFRVNQAKVARLTEATNMQKSIINLMKQQQERVVKNALEEYKRTLGKLKIGAVEDYLRNKLNLNNQKNVDISIIGNNNNVTINI